MQTLSLATLLRQVEQFQQTEQVAEILLFQEPLMLEAFPWQEMAAVAEQELVEVLLAVQVDQLQAERQILLVVLVVLVILEEMVAKHRVV